MRWLVTDFLERFLPHRAAPPQPPPQPPPKELTRDPDLDQIRHEQHELINRMSGEYLRDSMRARRIDVIEESWRRERNHNANG